MSVISFIKDKIFKKKPIELPEEDKELLPEQPDFSSTDVSEKPLSMPSVSEPGMGSRDEYSVIKTKLDLIDSRLENIDRRLANIEKIARESQ